MATAAELTGEEIAAVAESLSDPANLNVDTMAAIMHRIGPGLMALGQKVLVALIIFLIGRKVISMIEKMLSRSMEHAAVSLENGISMDAIRGGARKISAIRLIQPPQKEATAASVSASCARPDCVIG